MKRSFSVTISFQFELDDENYSWEGSEPLSEQTWGYGQYKFPPTVEEVYEEIRTCVRHEFARDEAGITQFPDDMVLTVKEIK